MLGQTVSGPNQFWKQVLLKTTEHMHKDQNNHADVVDVRSMELCPCHQVMLPMEHRLHHHHHHHQRNQHAGADVAPKVAKGEERNKMQKQKVAAADLNNLTQVKTMAAVDGLLRQPSMKMP